MAEKHFYVCDGCGTAAEMDDAGDWLNGAIGRMDEEGDDAPYFVACSIECMEAAIRAIDFPESVARLSEKTKWAKAWNTRPTRLPPIAPEIESRP